MVWGLLGRTQALRSSTPSRSLSPTSSLQVQWMLTSTRLLPRPPFNAPASIRRLRLSTPHRALALSTRPSLPRTSISRLSPSRDPFPSYLSSRSYCSPSMPSTTARLTALRAELRTASVDAFLIPSEDAHASEYIQDADKRRAWTSGFTGSAGVALVTQNEAWLFTDGR